MTVEGQDKTSGADASGAGAGERRPAKRRALAGVLSELWHQKPGSRIPREPAAPARTQKEVVEGLDQWELRLSIAATVLQGLLTPFLFWFWRTHGDATVRKGATEFLVTGIVSTVLLLLGTVFKRRALVGFAAFMTGFGWLTYQNLLLAALFLFFGGWLIIRVMRKQKQDRAAGKPVEGIGPRRAGGTSASNRAAPASKRYTPPRRATTTRRATSGRKATQGPRR